jgi:hypothetical protein
MKMYAKINFWFSIRGKKTQRLVHNSVDPVVLFTKILAKLKEMYNKINYTLYSVCM